MSAPPPRKKQATNKKMDAAKAAIDYLDSHRTQTIIGEGVAEILRLRPEDPVVALGKYLQERAAAGDSSSSGSSSSASVDPRGLVDTRPEEKVDPLTAGTAAQLAVNASLVDFSQLVDLNLKKAGLMRLPAHIGTSCPNVKKLELSMNPNLSTVPDDIQQLKSLRILFALGCGFTSIPEALGKLPSLYMLSFKSNKLKEIAASSLAPTIEWLILTDNQLTALPPTLPLGLRKVMLTNNKLASLPAALLECKNLELLRLADNKLERLPDGMLQMPKLSWLALAGNPLIEQRKTPLPPPRWIAPEELIVQDQLGAGGGGFVHRAVWTEPESAPPGAPAEVAIKIFRGAGTVTDGDPRHEIDLGSALLHPNVIGVIGASKEPRLGLVLELLDTKTVWSELGKPPNFDTCTRDTYAPGTRFKPENALRTLCGVAKACAHLHSMGFTHGDLYSHNTLVDTTTGEAKVGDFGAAYNYEPLEEQQQEKRLLERMEVRAFGCMAEELVARLEGAGGGDAKVDELAKGLNAIVARCMFAHVPTRPLFTEVVEALAKL